MLTSTGWITGILVVTQTLVNFKVGYFDYLNEI